MATVKRTIRKQKQTFWSQCKYSIVVQKYRKRTKAVLGMFRRTEGIGRNYELPVLNKEDKLAVNSEKAEPLAETFRKVHSLHNLKEEVG